MTTLWDKIKAWLSSTAQTVEVQFSKDEQIVLGILQPLLGAAEAALLQDLITFIRGVLTSGRTAGGLDEWETIILNGLSSLKGELLTLAQGLGSNVLQALIGLVLADLAKAAL